MSFDAANMNHLWSDLLIEELLRAGVSYFVLSPGSRCTPLTLAVARNPRAKHTIHFDERGAAFFALGHAKASGKPVALVCTSGSAVANYWPAVVEAEASRVPLILLTADRPPELLQCGANQAIEQQGIFGKYTRWAHTLPCPTGEIKPEYVLTTADTAVQKATSAPAGPVHLNCMFREPLAPEPRDDFPAGYGLSLAQWKTSGAPYTTWYDKYDVFTHPETYGEVLRHIMNARNGVCVVGQVAQTEENHKALINMAENMAWPLFVDATAGLFPDNIPNLFQGYDNLFCSEKFSALFNPEFVLHIGGAITSKRMNQRLEQVRPTYFQVTDSTLRQDPSHIVTHRLHSTVSDICDLVAGKTQPSALLDKCQKAFDALRNELDTSLVKNGAITEMQVARICSGYDLFAANSMPVRDVDRYPARTDATRCVYASRGASGIDGNIATVAGIAHARKKPMVALLGDLAALHDLNSFALLRGVETPLVLVIINNDGGGIFSFLPIAQEAEHFEKYFGTPHGMNFEHAATMFGLNYQTPQTADVLKAAIENALSAKGTTLIEVKSYRDENISVHRSLQSRIAQAVDKTVT